VINKGVDVITTKRLCELFGINRSSVYYCKKPMPDKDIKIMNEMREIYGQYPILGYRKLHAMLMQKGYKHNRKKTERLARLANLKAIYPEKRKSRGSTSFKHPYLLKDLAITHANQVWQTDITYIKMKHGFVYATCFIDVFSRKAMHVHVSTFLDTSICIETLKNALLQGKPEIINSDQGSQFTSAEWYAALQNNNIKISMDGKGRWADNIYIERFWRSLKYEALGLRNSHQTVQELKSIVNNYVNFYNNIRPHQALKYQTPNEVFQRSINCTQPLILGVTHDSFLNNFDSSKVLCHSLS
jgi:putative transposase